LVGVPKAGATAGYLCGATANVGTFGASANTGYGKPQSPST